MTAFSEKKKNMSICWNMLLHHGNQLTPASNATFRVRYYVLIDRCG
jgi:hypothetical protein